MIAEKIKNTLRYVEERIEHETLTMADLMQARKVLLDAADQVEKLEQTVVPLRARRDEGAALVPILAFSQVTP
ncbi:MAG: hypothetical protein ACPGO3_00255 [Magnetospiraceae bacterium]